MKTILITGGMGYIGGRLATELVALGYEVHCGTRQSGKLPPSWLPEMQMIQLDWNSDKSLQRACNKVDCIIHLAGMNENESAKDPVGSLRANGINSVLLLEAAKKNGVKRFIYFSTAHIYGMLSGEITENTLPRPAHPYAISHKVAEDFLIQAHDKNEIEGIVLRLSNVFGCPATPQIDRYTLLVNNLCRQAATDGVLRLKSSGEQVRDFITLGDTVNAVSHLLVMTKQDLSDGLFNLGGRKAERVIAMAQRVALRYEQLTGKTLKILHPETTSIINPTLNYCSDKLFRTGFRWTSKTNQEIDSTLDLCIRTFGQHHF
jgi:UDP-glucose 4-epimerase